MDRDTLLIVVLVVLVAGGLFFGVIEPMLSGDAKAEKRQKALQSSARRTNDRSGDTVNRRKQVADSLKEVEQRGKSKRVSLEQRLQQAGLNISKSRFFIYQAVGAVVMTGVLFFATGEPLYSLAGLIIGGLGLPNWVVGYMRKKRIKKFVEAFPDAIDVIVRGIKAGLPLGDCLRVIGSEAPEPVCTEFRAVVEAQTMGLSAGEAVDRIGVSIPTAEANFFTIVINIQQKSGGNLAEALSGLSKVLRDRKKMRQKIQAMSSEAKASAGIIAALPFAVGLLVYISSPRYIELLWLTNTGRVVLLASAFWMFLGVMVMRKMISFDF